MGLRETLNQRPRIVTGITVGLLVLTLGFVLAFMRSGSPPAPGSANEKYFFTDDDGANYFADDATKVPPFQRNGKEAVRAFVYRCGGQTFVNHLERYTPEGRKKAEAIIARKQQVSDPTLLQAARQLGVEVKLPGKGAWVKLSDPKAMEITRPRCPGGGSLDDLEIVVP